MTTEVVTTNILAADYLEDEETQALEAVARGEDVPTAVLTVEQAIDRMRRIRYHMGKIEEIKAQEAALLAPLMAEIQRINAWADKQIKEREGSIQHHNMVLEAFYRANRPTGKVKSLQLPGGVIECRAVPDKVEIDDEAALIETLRQHEVPLVRTKYELDRRGFTGILFSDPDGVHYVPDPSGQAIPLPGVRRVPQPEKITVKVATDKPSKEG